MNEPFPLAYALLRLGDALSSAGATTDAAAAARESVKLAREMGATPLLEETEALGRRARRRIDEPSADVAPSAETTSDALEPLGITERELEVLRLIADGRSNSEIAQELFISRKTASAHVSHILAKLGVSTRVQAAAVAHRRGLISPLADA
jgi:DNA-binding NarL/FixJ family response regulator